MNLDVSSDERIGRAMTTGRIDVSIGEFALLLVFAAHRPTRVETPEDPSDAFVAQSWRDLAYIDPDLARQAVAIAIQTGDAHTAIEITAITTQPKGIQ
jgi:hypothetical protein